MTDKLSRRVYLTLFHNWLPPVPASNISRSPLRHVAERVNAPANYPDDKEGEGALPVRLVREATARFHFKPRVKGFPQASPLSPATPMTAYLEYF